MLEKHLKPSSKKTWLDLPKDYVISKFYELGYYPQYNKYNDTYQCSCPICREGKSLGKKKRCYYTPKFDLIYCHNCGWSSKPFNWIKEIEKVSKDDIQKELESGDFGYDLIESVEDEIDKKIIPSLPEDSINLFDKNQISYWKSDEKIKKVLSYMKERNLFKSINRPDAYYFSFKDRIHKNRLIIPFKDEKGKIIFYQSRKIFDWDESPKYKSKINSQKSLSGLDKLDSNMSYVFAAEGPIDSFFIRNGISVGGINEDGNAKFSNLQREQWNKLLFFEIIWVLDSQWLDNAALKKTKVLLEKGERVFIWPERIGKKYKDFNSLCSDRKLNEISTEFILKNSCKGLSGITKLKLIG